MKPPLALTSTNPFCSLKYIYHGCIRKIYTWYPSLAALCNKVSPAFLFTINRRTSGGTGRLGVDSGIPPFPGPFFLGTGDDDFFGAEKGVEGFLAIGLSSSVERDEKRFPTRPRLILS